MASLEGCSTNKSPTFIGTKYAFCKIRMGTYMMSLGTEFLADVEEGYAPMDTNT